MAAIVFKRYTTFIIQSPIQIEQGRAGPGRKTFCRGTMSESVERVGEKVSKGVRVVIDTARSAADSAISAARFRLHGMKFFKRSSCESVCNALAGRVGRAEAEEN